MPTDRRPRKRRIAADEAHAWARNLRLGNPYAKLTLCMLTLYVDGEGSCFVGLEALAEDCELSVNTVRARLKFLEEVGAIARFPQWIDEQGRRNRDAKGRRTTDEIRLLHGDCDGIEAAAANRGDGGADASSPPRDGGADPPQAEGSAQGVPSVSPPASPPLATQLRGGAESLEPEPEPEDSPPNPPPGGIEDEDWQKAEARLAEFKQNYGIPSNRPELVRTLFLALPAVEQELCVVGGRAAAQWGAKNPKHSRPAPEKFIRDKAWRDYVERLVETRAAVADMRHVPRDSREGLAWQMLHRIARLVPFQTNTNAGEVYVLTTTLDARALACAEAPWRDWCAPTKEQGAAWKQFLAEVIGKPVAFPLRVPKPWPPRVDGTWSPESLSDAEAEVLARETGG